MAVLPVQPATSVLTRVLVGVDGTAAGLEAAEQAGRLVPPDGEIELVNAVYIIEASLQGWPEEKVQAALEEEGGPAVRAAAARIGAQADTRLINGPPMESLLQEIDRFGATLVAVGSHGHSRLSEMLLGGVAGPLLHEAPCAVLVARPPAIAARFPSSIVVGVDGSRSSREALAVARVIGERFAVPLRVLVADAGEADLIHAELVAPELEIVPGWPVEVLVEASRETDLVVLGNRGLRNLRALGSVSERVAHQAVSSVLVVRIAPVLPPHASNK